MTRILLISPPMRAEDFARLERAAHDAGASIVWTPSTQPHESLQPERSRLLADADAIVLLESGLDARQLQVADRCIMIAHAGPGADGIDLETARLAGMQVVSVPDGATDEYTELTMNTMREMIASSESLQQRTASRQLRVGLVGFGQVGRSVAVQAQAMGAQVWAADPFVAQGVYDNAHVRPAELPDLLGICDIVTMQLPLHSATQGILDREGLELLKRGSCLINTSHPELVDLGSLLDLLARGRIGAAALAENAAMKIQPRTQTDAEIHDLLVHAGNFRRLRADFFELPDVKRRSVERALNIVLNYFAGEDPPHLLIDPPLPRRIIDTQKPNPLFN